MPPRNDRLLSATVTLALVAFVWPPLAWAMPVRLQAAIGTALALAWIAMAAILLARAGRQRLWLATAAAVRRVVAADVRLHGRGDAGTLKQGQGSALDPQRAVRPFDPST